MPNLIPEKTRINQIQEICKENGYSFMGWDDGYNKGKSSRFTCECPTHGCWSVTVNNFINHGRRCPSCHIRGETQRSSRDHYEHKLKRVTNGTIYRFLKWEGDRWGMHRKAVFECELHGQWVSTFNNFYRMGKRCKGCAKKGYKTSKKGTLYFLLSENKNFLKIGISNNADIRLRQLKHATPFEFTIFNKIDFEDGKDAFEMEKFFHGGFKSANLKGFDGCTEWLVCCDELMFKVHSMLK